MPAGFHEVLFPVEISQKSKGGPSYNTSIVRMKSGFRKANQNWEESKHFFNIATGLKSITDMDNLIDFFHARKGAAFGFRFKFWTDYNAVNQNVGWGTASTDTEYQMRKIYTSGQITSDAISATVTTNKFTSSIGRFRDVLVDMYIEVSGYDDERNNGLFQVTAKGVNDANITVTGVEDDNFVGLQTESIGNDIVIDLAADVKNIKKPVAGIFTPQTQAVVIYKTIAGVTTDITSDATIDETAGTFTLSSAPGITARITWTGEFHLPVAFNDDFFDIDIDLPTANSVKQILLEELLLS